MYSYSPQMLLLFFYIYGFMGWIYESIYVSIRTKKLINRGFVKGPILPIYGLGATIIVYTTKPFVDYPFAVFIVGMLSATLLEYVSGFLLEKAFKVRYWDYTGHFGNIKGYICFISVIVWGAFSLFTVYFLHTYVTKFINLFNLTHINIVLFVLTLIFAIDLINSFKMAYDIRNLSKKIEYTFAELKLEGEHRIEILKYENELKYEKFKKDISDITNRINKLRFSIAKGNPTAKLHSKYRNILNEIKEYSKHH